MKTIAWIALKEIKSSFYTMRILTLLFLFTLFLGSFFFYYIDAFLSMQNQAQSSGAIQPKLSQILPAYFEAIHFLFIFLVPALSMGIFAEEKKNHSIRLYQASPLTATQVVAGKFLGYFTLFLLIIAASLMYPCYLYHYGTFDLRLLFSGYVSMLLLACHSLAFGMWISAISQTQFSAFLATIFGLFSFLMVSSLASLIRGQSVVYKVLKYIGMADHYSMFAKGLITVADVGYFILMSLLFLFFSVVSYEGFKWR